MNKPVLLFFFEQTEAECNNLQKAISDNLKPLTELGLCAPVFRHEVTEVFIEDALKSHEDDIIGFHYIGKVSQTATTTSVSHAKLLEKLTPYFPKLKYILLTGCESVEIAEIWQNETKNALLALPDSLPVADAQKFILAFYQKIGKQEPLRNAFEAAKMTLQNPIFLGEKLAPSVEKWALQAKKESWFKKLWEEFKIPLFFMDFYPAKYLPLRWAAVLFPVLLLGLSYWLFPATILHYTGQDKAFAASDTDFKILVIPFNKKTSDGLAEVGQEIERRIADLKMPNVKTAYITIRVSPAFNIDSATALRTYHNADQIIYGEYMGTCSSEGQKICYNYETDEKWKSTLGDFAKDYTSLHDSKPALSSEDILKGGGQEKIDYVVYTVAAQVASNKEEYLTAIAYYHHITEDLKIKTSETYLQLGNNYFYKQNYLEAEDNYCKTLEINPKDEEALHHLGIVYTAEKNYVEAKKHYLKAIEINPKFGYAWANLGNVYEAEKNYIEAKKHYLKAIEINAKDEYAWYHLGDVYKAEKNYIEAKKHYFKAIEINPKFEYAWYHLGDVYEVEKNYIEAKKHYLKAIEINPKFESAWNGLGNVYDDIRNYIEAEKCYLKALEINPKYGYAWNGLGVVYGSQEKYDEAKKCFFKALEISPKEEMYWINLGILYKHWDHPQEAKECFSKASQLRKEQ